MSLPIISTDRLTKRFPVTRGVVWQRTIGRVNAVDAIDLALNPGETLALVGESGCGKTTTAMLILGLLDPDEGAVLFQGESVAALRGEGRKVFRRSVQAVLQDPYSSLNPRMRVGEIVAEPLVANGVGSRAEIRDRVRETLLQVGMRPDATGLYPHEFSGGQRQRIAIARALVLRPALVVLDEPVSALDVSVGAQVMNLLKDLQTSLGVSFLLISHGLGAVRYLAHRVAVMYLGKIVECAATEAVFNAPRHPYTRALLSAALPYEVEASANEVVLAGEVPSPMHVPGGCAFHPRCFLQRVPACFTEPPALREVAPDHEARCHLA